MTPKKMLRPKPRFGDAKGVFDEIINALRRGKTDALLPTVVDQLVVLGPGSTHAFTSRSDAVVAMSGSSSTTIATHYRSTQANP